VACANGKIKTPSEKRLAKIAVFLGKNSVFAKVFFPNFSHTVQQPTSSKAKTDREKTAFLCRSGDLQGSAF
jgi:hypothetical protein